MRILRTYWFADLDALIRAGRGDIPLVRLRWRCTQCCSERIDMICTSRDMVVPWRA